MTADGHDTNTLTTTVVPTDVHDDDLARTPGEHDSAMLRRRKGE
jgi:hypothetical protein